MTGATPLLELSSASSGPGDRREADRAAAALGRQSVRAVAAGARRRVHRRLEVLAPVRQRRHARRSTPTDRPAATSSRSTDRRTWPAAAAWRSCRPPAPCRSSRSRRRASTPATATPPARSSTSRSRAAPTRSKARATTTCATKSCRRPTSSSTRPAARSRRSSTTASADRGGGPDPAATARSSSARSEWLYDEFPEPGPQTVPTEAMRNGDFSALLSQGITIYDPATARLEGGVRRADAVPGQHHSAEPHQSGRAAGADVFPAAEPGRRRAGPQQLLLGQSAHRRLLFDLDPRRSPADRQAAALRALRQQRSPRVRATRSSATSTASVRSATSCSARTTGSRYDHVYTMTQLDAAQRARRLVSASRSRTSGSTKGVFDPASLGFSRADGAATSAARSYLPRFDFDSLTDIGDNIAATTIHSIYSFQPTITTHLRQSFAARRLRRAALSRIRLRAGPRRGRNTSSATQLHARSGTTRARLFGQDVASFLLGIPTGGSHRPQRRAPERHVVSRRVRAGRLEDHRPADRQPRPALRIRGRDDRFAESQRARVRSDGGGQHRGGGARGLRRQPDSGDSRRRAFNVRGGLQFASDSKPGFYDADGNNIQPRAGFAYALIAEDRRARRRGRLRGAEHHLRQLPAGVLAVARRSCRRSTTA